jgi:hypothetical protein
MSVSLLLQQLVCYAVKVSVTNETDCNYGFGLTIYAQIK